LPIFLKAAMFSLLVMYMNARLDSIERRFDARFEGIEHRFDAKEHVSKLFNSPASEIE